MGQSIVQLVEGVLFRQWETPAGDKIIKQLVLPHDLQSQVLCQLDNAPTAGHLGVSKTLSRIRERFYWVQCSKDIKNYCRKCNLCASRQGPARKIKAPLSQYTIGVAGVLVKEFVAWFGVPLMLHSDQGWNFESIVSSEMCELLGITKTRTTLLHPQSDGMVEHFNRTLEAQLFKFVEDHQHDWDSYLHLLLMAYRTAVHESTGCTPASLMLGRDLRLYYPSTSFMVVQMRNHQGVLQHTVKL